MSLRRTSVHNAHTPLTHCSFGSAVRVSQTSYCTLRLCGRLIKIIARWAGVCARVFALEATHTSAQLHTRPSIHRAQMALWIASAMPLTDVLKPACECHCGCHEECRAERWKMHVWTPTLCSRLLPLTILARCADSGPPSLIMRRCLCFNLKLFWRRSPVKTLKYMRNAF